MREKKAILLVLLAILIVLLLALFGSRNLKHQTPNQTVSDNTIGVKKSAPQGQLISGFPDNLQPKMVSAVTDQAITDSFLIPYQNYQQYSATFETKLSVTDAYKQYLNFVNTNGYQVINKEQGKSFAHIYGTKTGADLNVTISVANKKTQINVSYLKK